MKPIVEQIQAFHPFNEQERKDKQWFLALVKQESQLLDRENVDYHMTASAWVVNTTYDKVLMVYHNIYKSYAWTGGHADGCEDMVAVAKKELEEETGIQTYTLVSNDLFALDILPVPAHSKHGKPVKQHYHINLTYLFCADEQQPLRIKEDENSDVAWILIEQLDEVVEEIDMLYCYHKLNQKVFQYVSAKNVNESKKS